MNSEQQQNNRTQPDRREAPTSLWDTLRSAGGRQQHRRASEHRQPYFVDRFSAITLALIVLLLAFSTLDAVLTLFLLDEGFHEINPVMAHLLNKGLLWFLLGKYVLTAAGLPLLVIFKNYYLFGTRFRVSYLIPVFVAAYMVLLSYQFWLLFAPALALGNAS
jgi:hypothetical protein